MAMNQNATSCGVHGPAVLLVRMRAVADPSPSPMMLPTSAMGNAPGSPNGVTTTAGNAVQVPGGKRSSVLAGLNLGADDAAAGREGAGAVDVHQTAYGLEQPAADRTLRADWALRAGRAGRTCGACRARRSGRARRSSRARRPRDTLHPLAVPLHSVFARLAVGRRADQPELTVDGLRTGGDRRAAIGEGGRYGQACEKHRATSDGHRENLRELRNTHRDLLMGSSDSRRAGSKAIPIANWPRRSNNPSGADYITCSFAVTGSSWSLRRRTSSDALHQRADE